MLSKDGTYLVAALENMVSATIPDSVTVIARGAFFDNQLIDITIPESVTVIEDYAFLQNQLASIIIPESVTTIGIYAFFNNQLTSVTILGEAARFNASWDKIGFPIDLKPAG